MYLGKETTILALGVERKGQLRRPVRERERERKG